VAVWRDGRSRNCSAGPGCSGGYLATLVSGRRLSGEPLQHRARRVCLQVGGGTAPRRWRRGQSGAGALSRRCRRDGRRQRRCDSDSRRPAHAVTTRACHYKERKRDSRIRVHHVATEQLLQRRKVTPFCESDGRQKCNARKCLVHGTGDAGRCHGTPTAAARAEGRHAARRTARPGAPTADGVVIGLLLGDCFTQAWDSLCVAARARKALRDRRSRCVCTTGQASSCCTCAWTQAASTSQRSATRTPSCPEASGLASHRADGRGSLSHRRKGRGSLARARASREVFSRGLRGQPRKTRPATSAWTEPGRPESS